MNAAGDVEPDDKVLLPPIEDRRFVEATLAALVESAGYEHLVLAPLVEPDERHFPDRWSGSEASLRRLLARLFIYADLDAKLDLVVHPDDDVGGSTAPAGIGALVWLADARMGTVKIAARRSALAKGADTVPAAARAVAEAWRATHRLTVANLVAEQRLVDVTSVFLGFGILVTAASIRHGAEGDGSLRLRRTMSRLGVVGPHVFAFALALQVRARGLAPKNCRAIAKRLPANQAGFFRASLELLDARATPVRRSLGIPEPDAWDDAPSLAMLTEALAPAAEAAAPDPGTSLAGLPAADRGSLGMNEGRPVFRVERSKAMRLARMLALPVVLLGMLAGRMRMGIDIPMWQIASVAGGLGLLGLLVGRLMPDSRCSEPKCGETLSPAQTTCPRCKGTISGVIHHPRERLAAEEALANPATEPDSD